MKKLPIGLQDFGNLRTGGYLYVDKTDLIHRLVTQGKYYFLSRPRRFGKSLLVSTISELYKGNKSIFGGLWIYDHWDWNKTNPVLDFRFNQGDYRIIGLEAFLYEELARKAEQFNIKLTASSYSGQFAELITKLSQSVGKVVVLIDEYDKPILDYLEEEEKAKTHRDILKNFYSVLKPLDPHLKFVFLTGVSKFSRVSIFSELNNLTDLTVYNAFSSITGITQTELEEYLIDHINETSTHFENRKVLLAKVKEWYNGYSWDGINFVYNPYSLLSFFAKQSIENFWFETGTPTFLIKLLKKNYQYDFELVESSAAALGSFELDRLHPVTLLFQTGYLTIKSRDEDLVYTLTYPNKEVRHSLLQYLLGEYVNDAPSNTYICARNMKRALEQDDLDSFVEHLNSLFSTIPYQIFIAKKEAYYHSVIYLALSLMGSFIRVEASQSKGRPDAVSYTDKTIYIFEFKLDQSAQIALDQIQQKGYTNAYQSQDRNIKAVGFNFSSAEKAVTEWKVVG
jgi:hypothetical protein